MPQKLKTKKIRKKVNPPKPRKVAETKSFRKKKVACFDKFNARSAKIQTQLEAVLADLDRVCALVEEENERSKRIFAVLN